MVHSIAVPDSPLPKTERMIGKTMVRPSVAEMTPVSSECRVNVAAYNRRHQKLHLHPKSRPLIPAERVSSTAAMVTAISTVVGLVRPASACAGVVITSGLRQMRRQVLGDQAGPGQGARPAMQPDRGAGGLPRRQARRQARGDYTGEHVPCAGGRQRLQSSRPAGNHGADRIRVDHHVEMEQAAHDAQGEDRNQEVFPVIRNLRDLLMTCGIEAS